MTVDNTTIGSTLLSDRAATTAYSRRRQLIAERVRARRHERVDKARMAFLERQLRIETEARIEQLRMALRLRQIELGDRQTIRSSMLLATMLSARELLERCKRLGPDAANDALYHLECQVDALYLAANEL